MRTGAKMNLCQQKRVPCIKKYCGLWRILLSQQLSLFLGKSVGRHFSSSLFTTGFSNIGKKGTRRREEDTRDLGWRRKKDGRERKGPLPRRSLPLPPLSLSRQPATLLSPWGLFALPFPIFCNICPPPPSSFPEGRKERGLSGRHPPYRDIKFLTEF